MVARADEITVSAAASLKDAFTRIAADFKRVHPQTTVRFNFGSSGTLQRQIEQGAPVDVFAAAADKNMDALEGAGLLRSGSRAVVARGELMLVAPRDSRIRSLGDLRGVRVVAIGGPGVPAGDYARQALLFYRLDAALARRLVFARDVRSVLALVASGNADAGFVYRSDALTSRAVRIVKPIDRRAHAPIRYSIAIVKRTRNPDAALAWTRFCSSAGAQKVFGRFGFKTR